MRRVPIQELVCLAESFQRFNQAHKDRMEEERAEAAASPPGSQIVLGPGIDLMRGDRP